MEKGLVLPCIIKRGVRGTDGVYLEQVNNQRNTGFSFPLPTLIRFFFYAFLPGCIFSLIYHHAFTFKHTLQEKKREGKKQLKFI